MDTEEAIQTNSKRLDDLIHEVIQIKAVLDTRALTITQNIARIDHLYKEVFTSDVYGRTLRTEVGEIHEALQRMSEYDKSIKIELTHIREIIVRTDERSVILAERAQKRDQTLNKVFTHPITGTVVGVLIVMLALRLFGLEISEFLKFFKILGHVNG